MSRHQFSVVLGRQTDIGNAAWRAGLVRDALATADIEIRDAAVHAAESWGGAENCGCSNFS